MLEGLKEKTEKRLKAGEITEEEAGRIKTRIEERIKEIKEFEKLPLEEKKKLLISSLESRLEKKVEENKLSQEKAGRDRSLGWQILSGFCKKIFL